MDRDDRKNTMPIRSRNGFTSVVIPGTTKRISYSLSSPWVIRLWSQWIFESNHKERWIIICNDSSQHMPVCICSDITAYSYYFIPTNWWPVSDQPMYSNNVPSPNGSKGKNRLYTGDTMNFQSRESPFDVKSIIVRCIRYCSL